ncbi:hypothetical protein ZWY2020_012436 [Hordeum vulgare]|nr:hypothetical protein ZWY2020_012436 [Hordeum vulgare]
MQRIGGGARRGRKTGCAALRRTEGLVHAVVIHWALSNTKTYKQFLRGRKPCCESFGPTTYCGEEHPAMGRLYSLCKDPRTRFFWDEAHPTHAGWEAVMKQLEEPIKEFLGVV